MFLVLVIGDDDRQTVLDYKLTRRLVANPFSQREHGVSLRRL